MIEKLYAGCAVRENWMPLERLAGRQHQQLRAMDAGARHGSMPRIPGSISSVALVDGKMVLVGVWKGVNGPG